MTAPNDYEDFIHSVCRDLGKPQGVMVYRKRVYVGRVSRRRIKTDVSFETRLLGAKILGLVECKCYNTRVEVSDVEEFHSKLDDIGAHKGIMFTTVGYEAGAKKVAEGRGIALFILRADQELGELRIERKSAQKPCVSSFLKGNLLPWGNCSGPSGYRVESADELFYLLAFSESDRFDRMAQEQHEQTGP